MRVRIIHNGIISNHCNMVYEIRVLELAVLESSSYPTVPLLDQCYRLCVYYYIPMANLHIFKFPFPQQPLIRSNNIYANCLWLCCLALNSTFQTIYVISMYYQSPKRNVNDSKIYITVFTPSPTHSQWFPNKPKIA